MKRLLLILMLLASVAQSSVAGRLMYHADDCYVSSDKCKLFDVINIRAGWWVLIPQHVREGWLFKLRNGSLVEVVEAGSIICGIRTENGKMFYIANAYLGSVQDPTVVPPEPPSSEVEADWVKSEGEWAD